jgi:organic hydroperoxide reductase OsmC/OhrA
MKNHHYKVDIKWTGNSGKGTSNYTAYERSHVISVNEKDCIFGSSDPSFRGDKTKYNPEELFVASLSTCHMLWFLHLCSDQNIVVLDYADNATGTMQESKHGGGRFIEVTLHPTVIVSDASMIEKANKLHHDANKLCYIANSCNFPIHHKPNCKAANA